MTQLRRPFVFLVVTISLFLLQTHAGEQEATAVQRSGILRQALVIRGAPGFPDNIAREDPIEAAVVEGRWTPPLAGETLRYNDTASGTWEEVTANEDGWFEHPSLEGGYASLSVEARSREVRILEGMAHSMVYVNGVPHAGNPYGAKDQWDPWEPRFDFSMIPVELRKGRNDFLVQCSRGRLKMTLALPRSDLFLNPGDLTLPDLLAGCAFDSWGAVVVVNASDATCRNASLKVVYEGRILGEEALPILPPLSIRKVRFRVAGAAPEAPGQVGVVLVLARKDNGGVTLKDTASVMMRVVGSRDVRKVTFLSSVDGSVQYYAINPARQTVAGRPVALVLSLHGAGVEAVNQAASYQPKTWAHIVSPTNRRPYGFNWEDWGRLDALEVLEHAKRTLAIDENRVYLTGHSMGGHGTYHLGVTFPDQFAAIGPSAGWISFWSYRVRQKFEHPSPMRQMVMRATLASDTYTLASNLAQTGVYILHGSDDDNVLVDQSRSMANHLAAFHRDVVYHEQKGVGHWWDLSQEPGTDCVDWPPMFDYLARHARPLSERVREIQFATASPGVSSRHCWLCIDAQTQQFQLSSVKMRVDPGLRRFVGTTVNVARLALDCGVLPQGGAVSVEIDSQRIGGIPSPGEEMLLWLEQHGGVWTVGNAPALSQKGSHRYGSLKDAIRNNVVFVFGTKGTSEENRWALDKARFDAERFWYQGNGSVDVVPDVEFDAHANRDRNVVVYGNAQTNAVWSELLGKSPVQVERGLVVVGSRRFMGNDLSCLFIRPRPGSDVASVGVIAGTGIAGMRLCTRMPYLMPGIGFPDLLISSAAVLTQGERGLRAAGFFGLDWSVENGEFVWGEE